MWIASMDDLAFRNPNLGSAPTLRKILPRVFRTLEFEMADIVEIEDTSKGAAVGIIYDPVSEEYEIRHHYHPRTGGPTPFPVPEEFIKSRNRAAVGFMKEIARTIKSFGRKVRIDPETPTDWFE